MTREDLVGKFILVSSGEDALPLIFGAGGGKYILAFNNETDALWFMTKARRIELGLGIRPLIVDRISAGNSYLLFDSLRFEKAELRHVTGPRNNLKEKGVKLDFDP